MAVLRVSKFGQANGKEERASATNCLPIEFRKSHYRQPAACELNVFSLKTLAEAIYFCL